MYLAGDGGPVSWALSSNGGGFNLDVAGRVNMLESFCYVKDWQTRNIHRFKSFMLDSGGFSFLYGKSGGTGIDWGDYVRRYARYVVENDVELFLELDIDTIVGYERVREYRDLLETLTGRRCIPVWHVERGVDDFLSTCANYPYVAIGGIAVRDGRRSLERYLPTLTREAHRRGAKVHGLGYTNLEGLRGSGLDSVDSTAWLYGNRGGFAYQWDGRTMRKVKKGPGQRVSARELARHNFLQWVEMAEAME